MVNFTLKTDMNHEAVSAISVFGVKFSLEFTSLAINFSWTAWVLKDIKRTLSKRMEKEKKKFQSQLSIGSE